MNFIKGAGIFLVFQLLFLCPFITIAQKPSSFIYTTGCTEAMKYISTLRLEKAKSLLKEEQEKYPDNVAIDYLFDCVDYYHLITVQDINELRKLEKNKDLRLQRIKNVPASSPYALYAEAEINLHWAVIRLIHQEYFTGAMELRSAYQSIEKNTLKFPAFAQNKKNLGFLKAMFGAFPENYNWILNIVGLKGDFNKGLLLLNEYASQKHVPADQLLDKQGADFYYVLLQFYFGDKAKSWEHCAAATLDYAQNPMNCYLRGLIGSRTAHNDEAINTLMKRPKGNEYATFYLLDYLLGVTKLNRLDEDADVYLQKYVTFNKGTQQMKDAYRRLAWNQLLSGDTLRYRTYTNLSAKYSGYADDEEKEVAKEFSKGIYPHKEILKARMLFDGGYYEQAEAVMEAIKPRSLISLYQKSEYHYRYGRIMQEQKKYSKAIELFNEAIRLCGEQPLYFAPYSSLQLGYIYVKLNYRQTGRFYFEQTIAYKNYESRGSTVQRAKLALKNLKE